ncbi:helix-turn-helix domain-containing protein [Nocardioides albus]|uniref:helix-turn-helix domain-containing protein n=1 Tax=Nocardioides albus TaxID=1841 RepID=UPI001C84C0CE|nr:helix-turn-helix transcriptional regulator [Nocardioides albus]
MGERVAFYRRRRGLTQGVLAGLVGRSEDWLSKIERGERELRKVDLLVEIAGYLKVTVGDLLGQPVLLEDEDPEAQDIPAVRDALMSPRRLSRVLFARRGDTAVVPRHVAVFAEQTWSDFQSGRIGLVVKALPGLIESAQALEELDEPASRWAVSARIHHLAASTLSKIGESDLAWLAAERAMHAADRSADPLVLASAARAGTHALLAAGRYEEAIELGSSAAEWLRQDMIADDPSAISLLGMLHLRVGVAAARHDDRSTANDHLRLAEELADILDGDGNYWQTAFGPTNVRLHQVSIALDLGDVAYVVDHADDVDTTAVPVERGACHRIDMAKALSLVAEDERALAFLLEAEGQAPQLVRHSATVRQTVKALQRRAPSTGQASSPLMALAERCRAVG